MYLYTPILKGAAYLGQYGTIEKCVVKKCNYYSSKNVGPSHNAYVTYSTPREAAIAILVFSINRQLICWKSTIDSSEHPLVRPNTAHTF
jgi:hypothetical protein